MLPFCAGGNSQCIVCAGDSIFAMSSILIRLSIERLEFGEITFSAGIAKSPEDAFFALKKAKGLGKRRVEFRLGGKLIDC